MSNAREAKLIQYLYEAHGKEQELETALVAHIALASRPAYRKGLETHLGETRGHSRMVRERIEELGGGHGGVGGVLVGVAAFAQSTAKRATALAKGPLHALRGAEAAETQLKNAKTEYAQEHEEIANYRAIEALAKAVGDTETAKLARSILVDERRMAKFLEGQIDELTEQVARAEIPASQRSTQRKPAPTKARSRGSAATR